jgi:hypothetical protein
MNDNVCTHYCKSLWIRVSAKMSERHEREVHTTQWNNRRNCIWNGFDERWVELSSCCFGIYLLLDPTWPLEPFELPFANPIKSTKGGGSVWKLNGFVLNKTHVCTILWRLMHCNMLICYMKASTSSKILIPIEITEWPEPGLPLKQSQHTCLNASPVFTSKCITIWYNSLLVGNHPAHVQEIGFMAKGDHGSKA